MLFWSMEIEKFLQNRRNSGNGNVLTSQKFCKTNYNFLTQLDWVNCRASNVTSSKPRQVCFPKFSSRKFAWIKRKSTITYFLLRIENHMATPIRKYGSFFTLQYHFCYKDHNMGCTLTKFEQVSKSSFGEVCS